MTVTITAAEARELLTRAVEEMGAEYVYPDPGHCRYFNDDGTPSCLVGHVLAYKGVAAVTFADRIDNETTVDGLRSWMLTADDRTARALRAAQAKQDSGEDWGTALAAAVHLLEKADRS